MTPREHALKVAVLSALMDEVKAALVSARKDAEHSFAEARKDGQTKQKVMLPDGTEIGLISIRGGSPSVEFDGGNAGLLAWCQEHAPHMTESYVLDAALEMNDVVEAIRERWPNLVRDRIRTGSLAELMKQAQETSGHVVDGDGVAHKVATVSRGEPTGAFSYRPAKGAPDRIMAEWQQGRLREIALGPLALPEPDEAAAG